MPTFINRYFIGALICAALASLLFLPGLGGGFIFDDKPNIIQNTALHITTLDHASLLRAMYSFAPSGYTRILAELTFALDHWRAGLDPSAFKATNIGIHALTTFGLAYFFRQLFLMVGWSRPRAAIFGLVLSFAWAAHPLHVSSVLYVVQRMQTLGTLFLVLALWAYLKMRHAQIEGTSGRLFGILTILCWMLALSGKEDSILLPVYTLAIELTVLKCRAANPSLARKIRLIYVAGCTLGILAFALVIGPHFWSSDAFPGRNFNSMERLLTQGRVLVMYLGQILLPLPSRLPFYYDGLSVSRSLLAPPSTLLSLLLLAGILGSAWALRLKRPLFSLGVILFFAGHAITSNVLGLELAFEHRNHFPLIGAVLAIADLLLASLSRIKPSSKNAAITCCALILIALSSLTVIRAREWGDVKRLSEASTRFAPSSARAWNALCGYHYEQFEAAGKKLGDPSLDKAIAACESGGNIPYAAAALSNLVIFKTIRGDVTDRDWDKYIARMAEVPPSPENVNTLWVMVGAASKGLPLDDKRLIDSIDTVAERAPMDYVEFARLGFFILEKTQLPERSFDYFAMTASLSGHDKRFLHEVFAELQKQNRGNWVPKLKSLTLEGQHPDRQP